MGELRKVCVVTGSRAEYGLLRWLMEDLREAPDLRLQVVATGMHLSPEFGLTYRTIERDGFSLDAKVEMLLSGDTPVAIAKSVGLGTIGMADALERLRPDLLVLLGDRFETLATAIAALVARIPVAHLHGGEATEGAIDEAIRHSVTKMSHLHFVAADPFRQRVIQLGEQPDRVFTVGAPGLDALRRLTLLDRPALERALGFALGERYFLVTFHPVTLSARGSTESLAVLLRALEGFPGHRIVMTYPNADTASRGLIEQIQEFAAEHGGRVHLTPSLGQLRYLSAVRSADAVIGNSSSGLIEVPALGVPTVNVGDRQKGRLRGASVIDCVEEEGAIVAAIERAISPEHRALTRRTGSPYGDGQASARILARLREVELEGLVRKAFYPLSAAPLDGSLVAPAR